MPQARCPGCQKFVQVSKPGRYSCPHCEAGFTVPASPAIPQQNRQPQQQQPSRPRPQAQPRTPQPSTRHRVPYRQPKTKGQDNTLLIVVGVGVFLALGFGLLAAVVLWPSNRVPEVAQSNSTPDDLSPASDEAEVAQTPPAVSQSRPTRRRSREFGEEAVRLREEATERNAFRRAFAETEAAVAKSAKEEVAVANDKAAQIAALKDVAEEAVVRMAAAETPAAKFAAMQNFSDAITKMQKLTAEETADQAAAEAGLPRTLLTQEKEKSVFTAFFEYQIESVKNMGENRSEARAIEINKKFYDALESNGVSQSELGPILEKGTEAGWHLKLRNGETL